MATNKEKKETKEERYKKIITYNVEDVLIRNKESLTEDGKPQVMEFPQLTDIINQTTTIANQNRVTLEILPELESAFDILSGVIVNSQISYNSSLQLPTKIADELFPEVRRMLNEFKVNDVLTEAMVDGKCIDGAVCYMVVPDDSIGKLISSATNGRVDKNKKLREVREKAELPSVKGKPKKGNESAITDFIGMDMTIMDMIDVDTVVKESVATAGNESSLSYGYESMEGLDAIFNDITVSEQETNFLISDNRGVEAPTLGLHIKVPFESVVPLTLDGDPEQHVGYFVTISNNGNVVKEEYIKIVDHQGEQEYGTESFKKREEIEADRMISRTNNVEMLKDPQQFSKLVDSFISDKISHIDYGVDVSIGDTNLITSIMYRRALQGKKTNIVYVPAEYMVYYAFDYKQNGVGKSLLNKAENLIAMKISLRYAKLKTSIENSLTRRHIKVQLDPTDTDPKGSMRKFLTEFAKSDQQMVDLRLTTMDKVDTWMRNSNTTVLFSHPDIPDITIDEDVSSGKGVDFDTEFMDEVSGDIYKVFGLTPQMMDAGSDMEFMTTAVLSNDLRKKKMQKDQDVLMAFSTKHSQMLMLHIPKIFKFILDLIKDNRSDMVKLIGKEILTAIETKSNKDTADIWMTRHLIRSMTAELPKLDGTDESATAERFNIYRDSIVDNIELIIGEDAIAEEIMGSDAPYMMEAYKNSIVASLLRDWMIKNDYLLELAEMITVKDGEVNISALNAQAEWLELLSKSMKKTNRTFKKGMKAMQKSIEKLNDGSDPEYNESDEKPGQQDEKPGQQDEATKHTKEKNVISEDNPVPSKSPGEGSGSSGFDFGPIPSFD